MNFADLDRAARIAASKVPAVLRPDVYQEAWLKFVRYAPLHFGAAYMMARHAMIGLMKREKTQVHTELFDVIEDRTPDDAAELIAALRRLCPEETAALLLYYGKDHHTGQERVQAFRQRRIIKRKLAHPKPTRKEGQIMRGPEDPKPPAPDDPPPDGD